MTLLRDAVQKKNRIFNDIVQNSFDTYPPYQIVTKYIMTYLSSLRYLPTFMQLWHETKKNLV